MPRMINANVTMRRETDSRGVFRNTEEFAYELEHGRRNQIAYIPSVTVMETSVPSRAEYLESASTWEFSRSGHERPEVSEALIRAWDSMEKKNWIPNNVLHRISRETVATSATSSSIALLARRHRRDERLRRMSPSARATYDRIRKLREDIGPIDFDVVTAIRELRDND